MDGKLGIVRSLDFFDASVLQTYADCHLETSEIHSSRGTMFKVFLSPVSRKGYIRAKKFNLRLLHLHQFGLLPKTEVMRARERPLLVQGVVSECEDLAVQQNSKRNSCLESEEAIKGLSLTDLRQVFILWLVMCGISILVFLAEVFASIMSRNYNELLH